MENGTFTHDGRADSRKLSRRAVLQGGSLLIAGAALPGCSGLRGGENRVSRPLRVGLVSDVHYAERETKGTRHYRDSLGKLSAAVDRFNTSKTDFVIELGDFIDAAETVEGELGHLERIESVLGQARCPRHHVLGNHCVYSLTKEQFLAECPAPGSYYSFDAADWHFVVLDGCFRGDGVAYGNKNFKWTDALIPPAEMEWLEGDLAATRKQTVVFVHQRLDAENHYGVGNSAEVRRRLEACGKVSAVFQGHNHINDFKEINGVAYCTLTAMVDGPGPDDNAYGLMELSTDGAIRLDGFGRQEGRVARQPVPHF